MAKVDTWFIFAIISLILWGFWGFFSKLTTLHINPKNALIMEAVGGLIVGAVVLATMGFKTETNPKGILLGIFTGIFAFLGALAFFFAVSKGKASVTVTMTALYPLLVILLSYFILHETLTIKQGVGIIFALLAVILFAG